MSNIQITQLTTVAELKEQFKINVGGVLRVYYGRSEAKDDVTLVSIGATEGDMDYRTSRTVGRFEEALLKERNLKVKVFTPDNWVKVLDGITLEKVKGLPRQTCKKDMAKFIAYKRSEPCHSKPKTENIKFKANKEIEANFPCAQSIEKYEKVRASLQNYVDQEIALEKLFTQYPKNENIEDILLKCAALNTFYSTQIYDIYSIAKHIHSLKIDEKIDSADKDIVNVMANVNGRNNYSFATKYCSHHYPKHYPIYDSFVDKMLKYFRSRDGFHQFDNKDLKDFNRFDEIINAFRKFYDLEDFSLLQIDNYLWLLGKEAFPK